MRRYHESEIPPERRERNPMITAAAYGRLMWMIEHPAAPAWNYEVGDRITREDLVQIDATRDAVYQDRRSGDGAPPQWIVDWVEHQRRRCPLIARNIPEGFPIERDWGAIPTMSREDIAVRIDQIVPVDADISRLIVYDTSGTTGHPIHVPHHPVAMAQNHPLTEFVLGQHGVSLDFDEGRTACLNVGAQRDTVVFATVFAAWNNAAFAKVNLHPHSWRSPELARRFFRETEPLLITGDPVGFVEMINWGIDIKPAALISTAVTLTDSLRLRLQRHFDCPVIDSYATTETGVVAYSDPGGKGMRILPTDIYVEIIDQDGRPLPEGQFGEICVTGGRNPYLPLVRYRTGDHGRLRWSDPSTRDPQPRLIDLHARQPVVFLAADGTTISPVDIGRILRQQVFLQHRFLQRRDRSCQLIIQPAPGCQLDLNSLRRQLEALFGTPIDVKLSADEDSRVDKTIPFQTEIPWED